MSQFERGGPGGATVVRQLGAVPSIIQDENLQAPGLVSTPIVEPRQSLADQLLLAVGLAGNAASAVANLQFNRALREDSIRKKIELADRGMGVRAAVENRAQIMQDIKDGKLIPPDGVDDETFFNDTVSGITSGLRPDSFQAASDALAPEFYATLVEARKDRAEKARKEVGDAILDSAFGVADSARIRETAETLRKNDPNLSDRASVAMVAGRSLSGLAASSDGSEASLKAFDEVANEGVKNGLDPMEVMRLRIGILNRRDEAVQKRERAAADEFYQMLANGVDPDVVKELANKHPDLTGSTRLSVQDKAKSDKNAAEAERERAAIDKTADKENSGASPDEVKQAGKDNGLTGTTLREVNDRADYRKKQKLADVQAENANSLQRSVVLGELVPDQSGAPSIQATVDEITKRMNLPVDSPEFISASQGAPLINALQVTVTKKARSEKARSDFDKISRGERPVPATPKDDGAIVEQLVQRGIVSGDPEAPEAVVRPMVAASVMNQLGRVPSDIQSLIASGVSSTNPVTVTDYLVSYAALSLQDRSLAASIDMPVQARVRAQFIMSRLGRNPEKYAGNEKALRADISALTPEAMRMNPNAASIEQDTIFGLTYFQDGNKASSDPQTYKAGIQSGVKNDLVTFLKSDMAAGTFGVRTGLFTRDTRDIESPPEYVQSTYKRILEEEFRIQRSFIGDDAKAAKAAKDEALLRTMEIHKPMTWGNRITFGVEGEPAIHSDVLRQDAEQALGPEVTSTLWNRYSPVYRTDIGEKPGWLFYESSDPSSYYINPDGTPLILDGESQVIGDRQKVLDALKARQAPASVPIYNTSGF
jgi:hypothetical protein